MLGRLMTRSAGLVFVLSFAACTGRRPGERRTDDGPRTPEAGAARSSATEFTVPVPDGYEDRSAELGFEAWGGVALEATELRLGFRPSIAVQKATLPGGSFGDPATCAETGEGLFRDSLRDPPVAGSLQGTQIIEGPTGPACQIRLVGDIEGNTAAERRAGRVDGASQAVAVITELARPGNAMATPQELWVMTCNHAPGDDRAEAACASALAGFRLIR